MIKGWIHQEEITVIKIHVPNNRAPKYMKQQLTEFKEETIQQQLETSMAHFQ